MEKDQAGNGVTVVSVIQVAKQQRREHRNRDAQWEIYPDAGKEKDAKPNRNST